MIVNMNEMKLMAIEPAPRLLLGFWNLFCRTFQRLPRKAGMDALHRQTCPGADVDGVHVVGKGMGN